MQNGMSALLPIADMCGALGDVRFVPIADIVALKQKDRLATVLDNPIRCFDQALAFRLLHNRSDPKQAMADFEARWPAAR